MFGPDRPLPRALSRASALGSAAAVTAATLTGPALAGARAAPQGPTVKLVATANSVTVPSYGGVVMLDPGIYVTSLGSALQFDVRRATYTRPVTVAQIIHLPGGGTTTRPLPGSVLDGFNGLRDFVHITVSNTRGTVVASRRDVFCPNSNDPQRAVPASAETSPFPLECADDPFPKSLVMGVARGWGVDSFVNNIRLAPGTYMLTATVTSRYRRLLHITHAHAIASVKVKVVNGEYRSTGADRPVRARLIPLASPARIRYLAHPPAAALPDLVPLPSWNISTSHVVSGRDLLNFAATVWVGGNGPLDVEGFRVPGTPVMKAYQYFWRNGHVIGRARTGTMGFADYNHWHFRQFARYALLNSARKAAVRSHKEGFCIGATDPVDLLARHAVWQPPSTGLSACGLPTALWVQEMLPVGWGDTYIQSVPGESFDITKIPNGTYYIEVVANPGHVLYESNTHNDISLRKVILGGRPGHRTVKVPAWHGIDPEH
jgi:hypothetical protein